MFDNLSQRLNKVVATLRGQARLSEDNIKDALREVRMALLEADVALPVVRNFIERVRQKAIGTEVLESLTPGQMLIKVVNEELTLLMGKANETLNLATQPPAVVLMAGLQGAGKTTSAAKLARHLMENEKKSVMLVSCDVYRPAAIKQLETLSLEIKSNFFPSSPDLKPLAIARSALAEARRRFMDVLIVDTAGRLHIDETMMAEIKALHAELRPIETLFVVDAMTGQDAATTAKAFDEALPLTGVVLTKADGDARGGAALSVRQITGKPIKFMGMGEKTSALEPFHPDRIASRILGMGDVLSLIEQVQHKVDHEQAEKLAKKLQKGQGFDLADLHSQLNQMLKMGGMASLMDKLPGMSEVPDAVKNQMNDLEVRRQIAIINSMTPGERAFPDTIKGSRKRRIAKGCGLDVQNVNKLLKQHKQMQTVMKKLKGGGMQKLMRAMGGKLPKGLTGGMPF